MATTQLGGEKVSHVYFYVASPILVNIWELRRLVAGLLGVRNVVPFLLDSSCSTVLGMLCHIFDSLCTKCFGEGSDCRASSALRLFHYEAMLL